MKLTVLGKSPSWQDAGGACSGYLLQQDGTTVLLDCGNGVFGKLRQRIDYAEVDAVLISHLHADHFLDLVPFCYALAFRSEHGPDAGGGQGEPPRPRLIAPPGAREIFRRVVGAWGWEALIEESFALEEYAPGAEVSVGGLNASFHPVRHFIDTFAVRVGGEAGTLVYSADTGPSEELVEIADGADLLLVEATLPQAEEDAGRGHLTAAEAGEHAARAGAKRVVLTHISDETDQERAREQAGAAFGGPVDVAGEFAEYEI